MEKSKEDIILEILAKFRKEKCIADQTLPSKFLMDYYIKLNPVEQKRFQEAIEQLVADGLVTNISTRTSLNLSLTPMGYDKICL